MGTMPEAERVKKAEKKKAGVEYNKALFALLRQKRKELADEAGVPPYVIFSDKTLAEMAAYYPQSITSLLTISGMGQVKLQRYGEAFLEIIQGYCDKHELKENKKETAREKNDTHRRYVRVAEAYNSGETIPGLIDRYHVTVGTIIDHLTRYLDTGNKLRNGGDLDGLISATPEQKQAAFVVFDEIGTTFLKPVYDTLGGALNYDDLKILRLLYRISQ